jgi:RNA polymerase nonessential primary-like sigma factor
MVQYRFFIQTYEQAQFNKIYRYESLVKTARTSTHPSIIAYFKLIELRDRAREITAKKLLKSQWAKLAQFSIRGLEISLKLGRIEWAELARISLEELDIIEQEAIEARRDIKLSNEYLITKNIKKHGNCGLNISDIIQHGEIGLDCAIDNFDRNKKVSFTRFAIYWIDRKIIEAIDNYRETIESPNSTISLTDRIQDICQEIFLIERKYPSISRIVSELHLSEQEVIKTILGVDPANNLNLKANNREELLDVREVSLNQLLPEIIQNLEPKERTVINLRYLQSDRKSLREIGESMKISKDTVRVIEDRAIKKMRSLLNNVTN